MSADVDGRESRAAHLVALASVPRVGPGTLTRCHAGDPASIWAALVSGRASEAPELAPALAAEARSSGHQAAAVLAEAAAAIDPREELLRHEADGRSVLVLGEPDYPDRLSTDPVPPAVLFATGDLGVLHRPSVAIVGTRNATRAGRELASRLAGELCRVGVSVVSGLALGIDGAAHQGAVSAATAGAEGRPVGVVASGLDVAYPARHARLHREVARQGVLVSETPLGHRPEAWRFPARNRIIAALADIESTRFSESPRMCSRGVDRNTLRRHEVTLAMTVASALLDRPLDPPLPLEPLWPDEPQPHGTLGGLGTATSSRHQPQRGAVTVAVMPGAREARIYRTFHGGTASRSPSAVTEDRDYLKCSRARALRTIRPFVVAHGLTLALTATYAKGVTDPSTAARNRSNYLRRVARAVKQTHPEVERMPWLYVPEFHQSGDIHDHMFLPPMARDHAVGKWTWGHAQLDELPDIADQRAFAEYVTKSFDTQPAGIKKRYDRARGFPVEVQTYEVEDIAQARLLADRQMGGADLVGILGAPRFMSETRLYL